MVAVLFSAGLDSAVLLAHALSQREAQPIYVGSGLAWERHERAAAARLLAAAPYAAARPLVSLTVDMRDVYPSSHWAVRGEAPAFDTPDEDVYIEGRNIVLLSKASVYMARAGLREIWLGTLAGNPFPDATREFFDPMSRALSAGLAAPIAIVAPFASMDKAEVIKRGVELRVPRGLTLSCMQPQQGCHCGRCSKCRERRDAFAEAGVSDPTEYATPPVR
jgi:7-cyano-7-deazaguanine synthase